MTYVSPRRCARRWTSFDPFSPPGLWRLATALLVRRDCSKPSMNRRTLYLPMMNFGRFSTRRELNHQHFCRWLRRFSNSTIGTIAPRQRFFPFETLGYRFLDAAQRIPTSTFSLRKQSRLDFRTGYLLLTRMPSRELHVRGKLTRPN